MGKKLIAALDLCLKFHGNIGRDMDTFSDTYRACYVDWRKSTMGYANA